MSNLPFGLIYLFSHFFYVLIYYLIPYRKKVVVQNLQRSFPELTAEERKKIGKQFYRYLTYLLAEAIKNLTISSTALQKRVRVRNPEVMDKLYDEGRSVLLLSSHFHNWELLITAQNLIFKHQAIGIGMPLSNKFWDKKINERRERFGMKVVNANNYKEVLSNYTGEPTATLILGDQSPGKAENCFWVDFLHQKTAFYFGAEILANQTDAAVVYAVLHRTKRGFYEIELREITRNPAEEAYGKITTDYIRFLEADIHATPYAWLWSHKRWKKQIPEKLEELQANHKNRFTDRFGDRLTKT